MQTKLGISAEAVVDEVVLVTGAEGCIGAWTVRNLALAGVKVVSTDLAPFGFRLGKILDIAKHPGITYEEADLRRPDVLPGIIDRHGVTRVIHLGAMQVPFVYADPLRGAEVNLLGTLHVLEAVRSSKGQVRGLSYASSAASVGPADAPHKPETLYGVYKLNNEHAARIYARDYGVPSIGLRPCIVYGPTRDQGLTSALTTALKAVALELEYQIPFGGFVDVQFAEDVASAFIRAALVEDNTSADVYDLHGDALTVEEYLGVIAEVEPLASALLSASPTPIPGNVVVDDSDLIARLGGLPKTPIADAIRQTLDLFAVHRHHRVLDAAEVVGG